EGFLGIQLWKSALSVVSAQASKFAVEDLSESISHEVRPLGIDVTILEPGAFRTDWAGRSMVEYRTIIEDYTETSGKRRQATRSISGKQPGDPA
ncbi:SDR family NAD(P)-dependent oxidoreductase, partial [Rhizobium ruizarguesonis]